jgi:hypothetical protein
MYQLTTPQRKSLDHLLKHNDSLKWTGKIGHYSNGDKVFEMYWKISKEESEPVNVTIRTDGTIK